MILDMQKVRKIKGNSVDAISTSKGHRAVVTVPADGFERLIAYHMQVGGVGMNYQWVHKDYRK